MNESFSEIVALISFGSFSLQQAHELLLCNDDPVTWRQSDGTTTHFILSQSGDNNYLVGNFVNTCENIVSEDVNFEIPIRIGKQWNGLVNVGNTCFINSIVQSLISLSEFVDFWINYAIVRIENPNHDEYGSLSFELAQLAARLRGNEQVQNILYSEGKQSLSVIPEAFIKSLGNFYSLHGCSHYFVGGESTMRPLTVVAPQQDAHEFLEWLLDTINDESHRTRSIESGSIDDDEWTEVGKLGRTAVTRNVGCVKTNTFIGEMCLGYFRSSIVIPGEKDSVTIQPFWCLQLDVLNNNVKTLTDAMYCSMESEMLTDLKRDDTEKRYTGRKELHFDKLPRVLIFHLKRFEFCPKTGVAKKVSSKVIYPELLEIPEGLLSVPCRSALQLEGLSRRYRIQSVVLHHGTETNSGHYTSWCYSDNDETWNYFDDDKVVRNNTIEKVLNNPEAYLLIYNRI